VRKDGYEQLTKLIDHLRTVEIPPPEADEDFLCFNKNNSFEEENKYEDIIASSENKDGDSKYSFLNIINETSEEFKSMMDSYKTFQINCFPLVSCITSLTSKQLIKNSVEVAKQNKEKKQNELKVLACLSATVENNKQIHSK